MVKETLWRRKNLAKSASTKNIKHLYKSKCYAVTNLKLTSSPYPFSAKIEQLCILATLILPVP